MKTINICYKYYVCKRTKGLHSFSVLIFTSDGGTVMTSSWGASAFLAFLPSHPFSSSLHFFPRLPPRRGFHILVQGREHFLLFRPFLDFRFCLRARLLLERRRPLLLRHFLPFLDFLRLRLDLRLPPRLQRPPRRLLLERVLLSFLLRLLLPQCPLALYRPSSVISSAFWSMADFRANLTSLEVGDPSPLVFLKKENMSLIEEPWVELRFATACWTSFCILRRGLLTLSAISVPRWINLESNLNFLCRPHWSFEGHSCYGNLVNILLFYKLHIFYLLLKEMFSLSKRFVFVYFYNILCYT